MLKPLVGYTALPDSKAVQFVFATGSLQTAALLCCVAQWPKSPPPLRPFRERQRQEGKTFCPLCIHPCTQSHPHTGLLSHTGHPAPVHPSQGVGESKRDS